MTKTSFTISWQPPEYDGGTPIIEYIVDMKETSKTTWKKVFNSLIIIIQIINNNDQFCNYSTLKFN